MLVNSEQKFSIQDLLSCPPGTILCLCVPFLTLFLLPNVSNPHTPTLERRNPPWPGSWLESSPKGGS